MIQYLETYCDLNEIYEKESIVVVGNHLMKNPLVKLHTFSKVGFVLHGFQELLQEKRDVESFMMMGDISSKEKLHRDSFPYEGLEQVSTGLSLGDEYNGSIIVFDKSIEATNSKTQVDELIKQIESRGGKSFVIG